MATSIIGRISLKAASHHSLRYIFSPNSSCRSKLCARTISSSRTSPWLMLPPAFEGGNMVYKFYSIVENQLLSINNNGGGGGGDRKLEEYVPNGGAKFVGSSHGWLASFNHRKSNLFLSNPLTRHRVNLPPVDTLGIPQTNLKYGCGCLSKLIISSSPGDEECRAMMAFSPKNLLAFCLPGLSTEWTPIGNLFYEDEDGMSPRHYIDFVYSSRQKLFFCITNNDNLESWDVQDPENPRIEWTANLDELESDMETYPWPARSSKVAKLKELCRQVKCLVFAEQSNELFLMTRHVMDRVGPDGSYVKEIYYGLRKGWDDSYPYKTVDFDVHKIDRDAGELRYVESSFDGLAMFVGINHAFAMPADEVPGLKPNSIYFTNDKDITPPDYLNKIYGGHDIGIFDYENRTFSPCYYPCDVQSIKKIVPAPMWFTPNEH